MLANYDAKAIADVLGIVFLDNRTPSAPGERFVITVDQDAVRVVYATSRKRLSPDSQARPPSSVLIEKAVENGLPRRVLRHVAEQLAGEDTARISSLEWGVVPKTTLERRVEQLSPQESERTERLARLFVHASRALGSEDEAREFLITSHPELDRRTPLEAAKTDLGTRRTEQILNALEFGLAL